MELPRMIEELSTQLDIFAIYRRCGLKPNTVLLESRMEFDDRGRFSFLGLNPFIVLRGDATSYFLNDDQHNGSAFDKLRELLRSYHSEPHPTLPMTAGCMGYVSYDAGVVMEEVNSKAGSLWDLPQLYYVFYDNMIIVDHKEGKTYLTACGQLRPPQESAACIKARLAGSDVYEISALPMPTNETIETRCRSNFSREDYMEAVEKTRLRIQHGDIYVMNLTRQLTSYTEKSAEAIYGILRETNPAPFSALMKLDGFEVISSSPERFLKVRDTIVETRPIKGTMPRGASPAEDDANRLKLLASAKDRAELLMIVDLERNDLNKVCQPDTVKVVDHCRLETFSTVFHLVSTVTGELKKEHDALDCFLACFPGGSVTGAPKRSAMTVIDSLERIKRGIYTGCIGYFGFNGNADFNIVIRTIIKRGDEVSLGVGGGITWESDASLEYQETVDKARALVRVI